MIRAGIGGWTFEPWRGVFYPPGLKHAQELAYASRHVTAIEVNGTFYRTQTPDSFRKWADETPDDFVFSLKGHRSICNRKLLAESGPALERFLASGLTQLGAKLGPILWQLAPTKRYDPDDIEGFLALLPGELDGVRLRHVLEVRHESFVTPDFVAQMRRHAVPIVFADSPKYPAIGDQTGPFTYARLQDAREDVPTGYTGDELKTWRARAEAWEAGQAPGDLALLSGRDGPSPGEGGARDCFVFFINGAKVRAPAAAQAFLAPRDPAD